MKKVLLFICAIIMALTFTACSSPNNSSTGDSTTPVVNEANTFIQLANDKVLTVYDSPSYESSFANAEVKTEYVETISYTKAIRYTLHRVSEDNSAYAGNDSYYYYNGYYYYWSNDKTLGVDELGKLKTTSKLNISYLPIKESEGVLVKTTINTTYEYDYEGGKIKKNAAVDFNLNNYWTSYDALKAECPELAGKIDANYSEEIYVDATTPSSVVNNVSRYESVFAVESRSVGADSSKLLPLGKDKVLIVYEEGSYPDYSEYISFVNYKNEDEIAVPITYVKSVKYTLNRRTYSSSSSVKYGDYYYYWTTSDQIEETENLGIKKTTTSYTCEYAPVKDNESVFVKENTTTKTEYDFTGGWISRQAEVNLDFGGYFASIDDIQTKCPELAEKINFSGVQKFYYDTTTRTDIQSTANLYEVNYAVEER